jgi:hypothetical protein
MVTHAAAQHGGSRAIKMAAIPLIKRAAFDCQRGEISNEELSAAARGNLVIGQGAR